MSVCGILNKCMDFEDIYDYGKAIRGSTEKCINGNIPYIVSAYLADIGISIGQVKVEAKSNEITAIQELLEILDIDECIITIDEIGTQTEIMDKIIKKEETLYYE